mmetsp:Transcript_33370/g.81344  ORF Transcript_33370/g.81344 Transcript_33370/m.81344 type:complete len:88 (+) Transcript_33370:155-418(+)
MPNVSSVMQRRTAILIHSLRVGPIRDHARNHGFMPLASSEMQRRAAILSSSPPTPCIRQSPNKDQLQVWCMDWEACWSGGVRVKGLN